MTSAHLFLQKFVRTYDHVEFVYTDGTISLMNFMDTWPRRLSVRHSTALMAVLAATITLAGCSSGDPQVIQPVSQDGGPDGKTADVVAPDVSQQPDAPEDVSTFDTGPADSGSLFDKCATSKAAAHLIPLDLFVMLDQSGSMTGPKWTAVTDALKGFAAKKENAELGMGLQFFPLPGASVCKYEAYATPEVPLAPLSTNASLIAEAIAKHKPAGETPTLPAVQGALDQAKTWLTAHPERSVAVILATDGDPNVCGSTVDNVAKAAKLGYEHAPSVTTFVIGVGSQLTSLDQVAAAGGSTKAYIVDDSQQNTQSQFAKALQDIRGKALSCEFDIPQPEAGTLDYAKVNVVHRDKDGAQTVYGKVASEQACGADGGWYYDDDKQPSKVLLCQSTCDAVQADSQGEIEVIFGCETHLL